MSMMAKFFRPLIRTQPKNNLMRHLSSSEFKLTEKDVEEIQIPVPWGHIAGKWWGDKDISPVLAIHGWQDNANSYDKLIPHLNVPSVLAIDLPGHGLSSHLLEGRAYDFSELVVTLHRIKKYFNWEQMPLLTHSLGGAVGYAYASMLPTEVKWFINFECSRTLLTLFRKDINANMSTGIDTLLKMEKLKKEGTKPAYKLSKMIEMTIRGSFGSISSPETALILLQRGMQEVDEPSVKPTNKISSDLADFVNFEQQELLSVGKEEKEYANKIFGEFMKRTEQGIERLKTFPLNDDKYYTFNRDLCLKVLIFQSVDEEFVIEASKNIKCPVLSIRAKQGFLFGSTKKLYDETLDNLKTHSAYLEHHEVDGTHHAHLNTPELLAPIINNFIQKWKWWGPKDQQPVLCVHGWQDNANSFNTLIPHLSPGFSYLAIDLPGHGISSHYPKGFLYKNYEVPTTLRRVQLYFGWDKVSIIGHSYGAACSFLFSSIFPDSVDFFIAIDYIKPSSKNAAKDIKEASKKIEKLLSYDYKNTATAPSYTRDDLLKIWIKSSKNELTENSCKCLIERGTMEANSLLKITRDPRVKHFFGFNFTHKEILKLAGAISCNVLFLKAANSSFFEDKDSLHEVLGIIKENAKYFEEHVLTGTHYIHLNNPEVVAPVINSFIQTIGSQKQTI